MTFVRCEEINCIENKNNICTAELIDIDKNCKCENKEQWGLSMVKEKVKCNRKLKIELSLCSYCGCMTKIIGVEGYCGKCKKPKKEGLMSWLRKI